MAYYFSKNLQGDVIAIMDKNAEEIKRAVLATEFVAGVPEDAGKEWNINGEKVTLGVKTV